MIYQAETKYISGTERLFKCGDCGKVNLTDERTFVILLSFVFCDESFSHVNKIKTIFNTKNFYLQGFTTKKNVVQHLKDVHTDQFFHCSDCGKVTNNYKSITFFKFRIAVFACLHSRTLILTGFYYQK